MLRDGLIRKSEQRRAMYYPHHLFQKYLDAKMRIVRLACRGSLKRALDSRSKLPAFGPHAQRLKAVTFRCSPETRATLTSLAKDLSTAFSRQGHPEAAPIERGSGVRRASQSVLHNLRFPRAAHRSNQNRKGIGGCRAIALLVTLLTICRLWDFRRSIENSTTTLYATWSRRAACSRSH